MTTSPPRGPLLATLALLLPVLAPGSAAAQGVVVEVDFAQPSAIQHQFAAGVVAQLAPRWHLLEPGLSAAASRRCDAHPACLRKASAAIGASHLLLIGAAPFSERELIVSLRLFRVGEDQPIVNASELVEVRAQVAKAGARLARAHLLTVEGVPKPSAALSPTFVTHQKPSAAASEGALGLSPLALSGWGLVGMSTAALVVGGAINVVQTMQGNLAVPSQVNAVVFPAAVVAASVGLGLVTADAYLPQ